MKPSFSDHFAAAWISALAGAAGAWLSFGVSAALVTDAPLLMRISVMIGGLFLSLFGLPFALVLFGVASMMVGPMAFWTLQRLGWLGPIAAAVSGAALSGLAVLIFGVVSEPRFAPLTVMATVGGAAAGWSYRRTLVWMGFRPPPAPTS